MDIPATRYVEVGGHNVAFQIYGEGPRDLLMVPGIVSHLDLLWADPGFAHLMRRFGSFARVISYDRVGVGLSDPVSTYPTLDDRLAEIEAVLDAAGSTTVDVLGYSEGGAYAGYFAAAHPERVRSIVFCVPWVCGPRDDPREGIRPEAVELFASAIDHWGEGRGMELLAPTWIEKPLQKRMFASFERLVVGPGFARAILASVRDVDLSAILPHVRVPALVVGVTGDKVVPIEHVRFIASAIPGAELFELEGHDHLFWAGNVEPALDAIERFVTGAVVDRDVDRILATVAFTDIVGSTQRLSEVGDRAWKDLVEEHDDCVRRALEVHGGREVKTLGDGALLIFDAPHTALTVLTDVQRTVRTLGLEIRAGVHSGDVQIAGSDLAGMTVNTAARISALAGPGEILISESVRDLLRSTPTVCTERGVHELKGVPGKHTLFAVAAPSQFSIGDDERDVRLSDRLTLSFARRWPRFARSINARMRARPAAAV
jgi:class 3 adenylate cyclase